MKQQIHFAYAMVLTCSTDEFLDFGRQSHAKTSERSDSVFSGSNSTFG